jgi:hypothetical protein
MPAITAFDRKVAISGRRRIDVAQDQGQQWRSFAFGRGPPDQ